MRERVQYKILIVDDSRMNRVLLKKYLCDAGYQVVEAENGKVGRELARSECPDLILLDIQMPVEDGFEAIGKLKMDGYTAQIPVIFLSGISDVAYKVAGFENGAVDFITKPFDAEEVKARVKVHIKISLGLQAVLENQREKLKQIEHAQKQMLVVPEEMPEAKFAAKYLPLNDAGGDFYSVVGLGNNLYGYFMGDVSGHDISTSYITAALNALLTQNCTNLNTPSEAMIMINKVLCQTLQSHKFLAATYLQINRVSNKAVLINMGNPPVVCISRTREPKVIMGKGIPLGMFENSIFPQYEFEVEPGDRFILFSDGLLEYSGDVWSNSIYRLLKAATVVADMDVRQATEEFCNYFVANISAISDDIAILTLEV